MFYTTHGRFTDPGAAASWIDGVPAELPAVRDAAARLVFHSWAYGDVTELGFTADRRSETELRYADAVLDRARELNPALPAADRPPADRVLGSCRDHTVIFLAIARQHGIAARARTGFADYLIPGWWLDHTIPEVWDATERRWRLVEPEFEEGYATPGEDAPLPLLDMARTRFLTGASAWGVCRAGKADPDRFVAAPGIDQPRLKGWPFLAHNVVFDLASLNKHEMFGWDLWGMLDSATPPDEAVIDRLAAVLNDPEVTVERIQAEFADPALKVPDTIASYPPPDHQRRQITLR
jgi:Transglutaminase-like superfamily